MPRTTASPRDTVSIREAAMRREGTLPSGRRFWVMPDMFAYYANGKPKPVPSFTIKYAGSVFFGRSVSWVRDHEEKGHFVLDGKPMKFGRDSRGARSYRLHDIEPMAHSLYDAGFIDAERLHACVEALKWVARLNGIMKD